MSFYNVLLVWLGLIILNGDKFKKFMVYFYEFVILNLFLLFC